jgi:hypothetical protein
MSFDIPLDADPEETGWRECDREGIALAQLHEDGQRQREGAFHRARSRAWAMRGAGHEAP